jgi:type IV pilus assembly protein PilN
MMTPRINLLPHRAERRQRARQHFFVLAGGTAVVGLLLVFAMHTFYAGKIDTQQGRNRFLNDELKKLDTQIAEIEDLRNQIDALIKRKGVIESLQSDRARTVHLLDELVKRTPEGVYVKSIVQKDVRVNLVGYAQSSARVSRMMQNIEQSPWLEKPELVEVKASIVDKRRLSEFNMYFSLKRPETKAGARPDSKAGAVPGKEAAKKS